MKKCDSMYECVCDTCGKVTKVPVWEEYGLIPGGSTYVTAYGYLKTKCKHCGKDAYTPWMGFKQDMPSRTGLFA